MQSLPQWLWLQRLLLVVVVVVMSSSNSNSASAMMWENAVDLSDDFRLHWTIKGGEITFELQVATLGYIGIGFSATGAMDNADMAVGWVDGGQAYFQVRRFIYWYYYYSI